MISHRTERPGHVDTSTWSIKFQEARSSTPRNNGPTSGIQEFPLPPVLFNTDLKCRKSFWLS